MSATNHRSPSTLLLLVASLVGGCVVPMPVGNGRDDDGTSDDSGSGDETLGASSSMPTTGDASAGMPTTGDTTAGMPTTDDPTDGGTAETGAEPGLCPDVPGFACGGPIDCNGQTCGQALSPFDAEGCMRRPCDGPDDCSGEQFCFFPYEDYEICTSSGMTCSDDTGTCECTSTPDCGGGYCMTDCFALSDDEASCGTHECSTTTVVEITPTCECIEDTPLCYRGPPGFGGISGYMWHEDTQMVAYFGPRWPAVPLGWHPCSEPGAPAACGCNDPLAPPTCP